MKAAICRILTLLLLCGALAPAVAQDSDVDLKRLNMLIEQANIMKQKIELEKEAEQKFI